RARGPYNATCRREALQRRPRPAPLGAPATKRSADVVSGPALLHPVGAVVLECDRATLAACGAWEWSSEQKRRIPGHPSHLASRVVHDLERESLCRHGADWGSHNERSVVWHPEGEIVPV